MKRIFTALGAFALSLCMTLTLFVSPVRAAEAAPEESLNYAGYLVILTEPTASPFSFDPLLQATLSAAVDEREELLPLAPESNIYKAQDLSEVENLVHSGQVAVLEPDYQAELLDVPTVPNDHYFTDQLYDYQFNLKGTNAAGDNGIRVQSAWDVGLSGEGVTVAVIDSGLNLDHIDAPAKLAPGRYSYYKEVPGGRFKFVLNGVTRYFDFYSSDWVMDDKGHGTMVSGIIAAKANNASSTYNGGIAGIAPDVTLMPLKCFTTESHTVVDANGNTVQENHLSGYVSNLVYCINYAQTNGADIINMSWGIRSESASLLKAITDAYNAGCILIAAAGNDGNTSLQYPAAYSNVISVGSTNKTGYLSNFSQRTSTVDVCAPGGTNGGRQIYSLGYSSSTAIASGDGTSFSAPAVTGAVALLKEADPKLTQADLLTLLQDNCDPVKTETADDAQYVGSGLLNLKKLLDAVGYSSATITQNDGGVLTARAAFHPKSSGAVNGYALLGAYNAQGHLLDVVSGAPTLNATYGTYTLSGSFDLSALPTISTVQAFFLDTTGGSFAPLCRPADLSLTP